MATTSLPQSAPRSSGVSEVHIIWLTAGLSCDGDSVSELPQNNPALRTCS
jgi:hydrogenase small subunit